MCGRSGDDRGEPGLELAPGHLVALDPLVEGEGQVAVNLSGDIVEVLVLEPQVAVPGVEPAVGDESRARFELQADLVAADAPAVVDDLDGRAGAAGDDLDPQGVQVVATRVGCQVRLMLGAVDGRLGVALHAGLVPGVSDLAG